MSKPQRPDVAIENWRELETYYLAKSTNPLYARQVARILGLAFHPRIHYLPGALEALTDGSGALKSIVPNHVSEADPPALQAWLWRDKRMRPLLRNAGIPSKSDVFDLPPRPIIRLAVEAVGTFINWGERDLPKEPTEDQLELYDDAKHSNHRLNVAKMLTSNIFGIYAEGTRGRDPEYVSVLKFGYMRAVQEVLEQREVETFPVGTYYGEGVDLRHPNLGWRTPIMVVGAPVTQHPSDLAEANGELRNKMQGALDVAKTIWLEAA